MAQSNNDSQATQQLAQFIESDAEQNIEQSATSEESQVQFMRSSQPPSLLHTHGLSSLRESQSNHDEQGLEGSQKENVDGRTSECKSSTKGKGKEALSSRLQPKKGAAQLGRVHKGSQSPFQSNVEPKQLNPAAHSPSHDSFAGPESDPARAYIAKSAHFNMDISRLGEDTQDENLGTVLVEGTPDNSGSQPLEEDDEMSYAQPRDTFDVDLDIASQASSHSDALAFWTGEAAGQNEYAEEATQPATQAETQPATQSTQPQEASPPSLDTEWDRLVAQTGMKINVPPNKRARYIQQLRNQLRNASGNSGPPHLPNNIANSDHPSTSFVATQAQTQVETQVDTSDNYYIPPRRQLPAPKPHSPVESPAPPVENLETTQIVVDVPISPPKRRQLPPPKRQVDPPLPKTVDDSMIVPDSEPPAGPSSPPVPTRSEHTCDKRKSEPHDRQEDVTDSGTVPDSEAARMSSLDPLTSEDDEASSTEKSGGRKRKMKKEASALKMPPPLPLTTVAVKKNTRSAAKAKGKGKAAATPEPSKTGTLTRTRRAATRQKDVEVVPSSIPDETPAPKRTTRPKATQKSSTKSSAKRKGTGGSSAKRRRTKYADDDSTVEGESSKDEDTMTEIAPDEDYVGTSSLKRKRAPKNTYDTVGSNSVRSSQTPRGRGSKPAASGLQVFALSKADGHYFAGTLLHRDASGCCFVEFMDKSTVLLQLDQIRRSELRLGDEILWEEEMVGWQVTGLQVDKKGGIQVKTQLYGTEATHRLEEIRITMRTIMSHWENRKFEPSCAEILSLPVRDNGSVKPSTSSVKPAINKKRPSQFLREFAIIGTHISESVLKELAITGARNTGQWTDVLSFGEHCDDRRWRLLKEDCGKIERMDLEGISRIFLVANAPYATPKYLMALALGVPCVSPAWLTEMVKEGCVKDWSQYLLPQGFSEHLGLRTSQLVDMDWGNSPDHIHRIMDNAAPAKLFKGLNILCITEDENYTMNSTTNLLPAIILAMGAELVEVVDSFDERSRFVCSSDKSLFLDPDEVEEFKKQGRETEPLEFHLTIYLRRTLGEAPSLEGSRARTWGWVKESLIASRLLPVALDMPADVMET
ncbi:hypothetical protein AAF712_001181 [Marasmius tenuissimus]|uniref:BRCT domain-containing protein n=1 Tax=Marasmius tenuissimus TaxID=585030 RepID=A0ABR3ABG9_9AGAR